jgi:hypothetical protein
MLWIYPERLLPDSGQRHYSGHAAGAAVGLVRQHGPAPAAGVGIIMKDPAVESLTSFVGVDGTNPALNSARLQINLKPLDERDDRVRR